ncbi:bifunctional (p)ppGpp synthetase/guanosine-3',5'-bis(diphosphate) 3'-pyrophosphohydrolase [Psychrilyobacter sp.]|uniref:RelA/SpoT family protein n=1 Tax=Psychrilyobacter sp. TaxID=2586924 RepID=UPI0030198375
MEYKSNIAEELKKNNLKIDEELIFSAYEFARESHVGQYRKSGEEYIVHPVEVSKILINMKMDTETITAGFLHDIVEDTMTTIEDIEYNFGSEVAKLVDGVTKLTNLPVGSNRQPENIRKMIVAMASDVRVVIIKLADRLHNMRTLKFMPDHKQERIARETLDIFAPLAHRIGMAKIKSELEDLCLYYLEPKIYRKLVKMVNNKRVEREEYTNTILRNMKKIIHETNIDGIVSGRAKHFYSIYKKMYEKGKSFDELYDLTAVRVLVDTEGECYNILGMLHSHWKPVPGRFKDYIAVPKSNGYQSIHTTLVGPLGKFIEVQIRTKDMHAIAEDGIAAHWNYKEKRKNSKADNVYSWLRKILEWQSEADTPEEFIQTVTGDILNETVFVFSPKGDVIELSKGSTPLDFAFHIHTEVGYKCIGAKANDKIVPIDYKLQNGDRIDIITSNISKGPGKDWLNIVATQSAKSKIRRWIKEQNFDENLKIGKELFEKELLKVGSSVKQIENSPEMKEYLNKNSINNLNELLIKITSKKLNATLLAERLVKKDEKIDVEIIENYQNETPKRKSRKKNDYGVIIDGLDNTIIRFAKCCTPLPGDEIGGYITTYGDIGIHRLDCKNYTNLITRDPNRAIGVTWDDEIISSKINKYRFKFTIVTANKPNILLEIVKIIADHKIDLEGINSGYVKNGAERLSVIDITIEINEKRDYEKLINHIVNLRDVIEIRRNQNN